VAITWDVNIGTVITIGVGFMGTLWRLHNWDVKTSVRHVENTGRFDKIETSHEEMKRDLQSVADTQKECQKKITETREMVIRLDEANKTRN